jgi:hypothetical protein
VLYDKVSKIVVIPAEDIIETEARLQNAAKANIPRLLFNRLDVLIVDQMGKEFSGEE